MTNGIKGRLKGGNVRVCSFQTTFYRLGVWQFVYKPRLATFMVKWFWDAAFLLCRSLSFWAG